MSKFSSEILSQIHFPQCYVFPQNNVHLGHCCTKNCNNSVILADFFLLSELVVSCVLTRHLVIMNYCFNNASLTLPKYSLRSQTSWQTNLLFSVSSASGRTHSGGVGGDNKCCVSVISGTVCGTHSGTHMPHFADGRSDFLTSNASPRHFEKRSGRIPVVVDQRH